MSQQLLPGRRGDEGLVHQGVADQRGHAAEAKQTQESVVGLDEVHIATEHGDPDLRSLVQCAEPLLALPQLCFGPPAVADVVEHHGNVAPLGAVDQQRVPSAKCLGVELLPELLAGMQDPVERSYPAPRQAPMDLAEPSIEAVIRQR